MEATYKKNKGNAGLDGIQFQVNLVTVFLLNSLRKLSGWKISTENQEAGKFDDIVLELSDGSAVFLQAKTKASKKITKDQLLSTNPKNTEFSLAKYFFSYCGIKVKFRPKAVIICTNTDLDSKGLEIVSTCHRISPDSLLQFEGSTCSVVEFNEKILRDLKESAEIYLEKNLQGKGIDKAVITTENLEGFLKTFQIVFNYPNGKKLTKVIDRLLSQLIKSHLLKNISSQEIYKKLEEWFRQERGEYLTETRVNALFTEIKSEKYCGILKEYSICFKRNDIDFNDANKIFHIEAEEGHLLPQLKVYHALQNFEGKTLYIHPNCGDDELKWTVEAFRLPKYVFLVVILSKITNRDMISKMKGTLKEILAKYHFKKVIFVCKKQLVQKIGLDDVQVVDKPVTFQDLGKINRERLLEMRNIVFQGEDISLNDLLRTEEFYKVIGAEVLEKLIKGERIYVGSQLSTLHDDTLRYYVSRKFERDISDKKGDQNMSRRTVFTEETIFKVEEKAILISDTAGMGKSTVLTKLAVDIKRKNPHLWIIRIELNNYTRILRDFLRQDKRSIKLVELLNSNDATKLKSPLEKLVFFMDRKVVVMLDGFDEISPDYTGLIMNLLTQCRLAANIAKIIITTRPHMSKELEGLLRVKPFVLRPFTWQNQVDFLTNYWMHHLDLDSSCQDKCKKYSEALIYKMASWICEENNFTAIPLQVKMIAEIFQEGISWNNTAQWEGCKEFLEGENSQPTLPEKMNITRLYELFTKKKLDIFIDKANPTGTAFSNHFFNAHFDEYFSNHQSLAIEMILNSTDTCNQFSTYKYTEGMEMDMLKIGMVQKFIGKLDFVHRTFAEYFVAKSVIEISQFHHQHFNQDVHFQSFFIDQILCNPEFTVIRSFIESSLEEVVDSLPASTFDNYKYHPCDYSNPSKHQRQLIHLLAGEGCTVLLRLILKCIDFKVINHREVDLDLPPENKGGNNNTLNVLQVLVARGGINLKDENFSTPLHFAAEGGHLQMVKFLIDQGASVEAQNKEGVTTLHAASYNGYLDVVENLVRHGADVNFKNRNGTTPLHAAAQDGHVDVVEFLMRNGARHDGNINGTTPLHLAAQDGHLDTVKFLVRVCDLNVRNNEGITSLHLAAANGHLSTVRYLAENGGDVQIDDNEGFTALHAAAQDGYLGIVRFLVDRGMDVDRKSKNDTTALQSASVNGHLEVVKYFIRLGIDARKCNASGTTTLHSATINGHLELIKYLVEHGADPTCRNGNGLTPLHIAAQKGHLDAVQFLAHEHTVNITDNNGFTPFHLAVQNGNLDIIKVLVQNSADIRAATVDGYTCLHLASRVGHLDTVTFFIDNGSDVNVRNSTGNTPLHSALLHDHLEIAKYLVEHSADINIGNHNEFTALHLAVQKGFLDFVKFLLKRGAANVKSYTSTTPLNIAAHKGCLEMVKLLVEGGVDVNDKDCYGNTALHAAVQLDHVDIVEYLVEQGVDVDVLNVHGFTALHEAAKGLRYDTIVFYLKRGLNLNVADRSGRKALYSANYWNADDNVNLFKGNATPLHVAVNHGDLDSMLFFIERGMYLNERDSQGRTPLHEAAMWNRGMYLKLLVICGGNFNVKDRRHRVPLHYVARNGDLDCLEFLIQRDADMNVTDHLNHTPLHVAARWGNLNCVKFLMKSGANYDDRDVDGRTLLHLAARWGDADCLEYFVDKLGTDVDVTDCADCSPLHFAARWGDVRGVMCLLDNGASAEVRDSNGRTPLHAAARWTEPKITKYLVHRGVCATVKDKHGNTPLHTAAQWGDLDIVQYFVEQGIDVNVTNYEGHTPLHAAALWGDLKCMRYLLAQGATGNVTDHKGRTPLHLSASWGDLNCVKFLVEQGLDVSAKDSDGRAPLYFAAWKGKVCVVEYLVQCGTDVNIRDNRGRTSLHSAVISGGLDCVRWFVQNGADFNIRDHKGCTPLHLGAWLGRVACVRYLAEVKADVDVEDNVGRTALHVAARYGRFSCLEVLVQSGACADVEDEEDCTSYTK